MPYTCYDLSGPAGMFLDSFLISFQLQVLYPYFRWNLHHYRGCHCRHPHHLQIALEIQSSSILFQFVSPSIIGRRGMFSECSVGVRWWWCTIHVHAWCMYLTIEIFACWTSDKHPFCYCAFRTNKVRADIRYLPLVMQYFPRKCAACAITHPKPPTSKKSKHQTQKYIHLIDNHYGRNITVGIAQIHSIYQFSALFRLVVVSWRRSNCVQNGTSEN